MWFTKTFWSTQCTLTFREYPCYLLNSSEELKFRSVVLFRDWHIFTSIMWFTGTSRARMYCWPRMQRWNLVRDGCTTGSHTRTWCRPVVVPALFAFSLKFSLLPTFSTFALFNKWELGILLSLAVPLFSHASPFCSVLYVVDRLVSKSHHAIFLLEDH